MKQVHITGKLLMSLLVAGLLTACNSDQLIGPIQADSNTEISKNAKISSEVLLIKDGDDSLEYVKSGKFAGKLAKTSYSYGYTLYTYDDSAGDLWITSRKYSKASNKLVHHKTYQIANGRCIASKDLTNKFSYEYKYNSLGSLIEIKRFFGVHTLTQQFSYKAIAPNVQRLNKITHINESGPIMEYKFSYSPQQDKYFLNPYHTQLDKYLRVFGTFSDKLVQDVTTDYLDGSASSNNYTYVLNGDGYVTSRTDLYHPNIYEPYSDVSTQILEYTNAWQGL